MHLTASLLACKAMVALSSDRSFTIQQCLLHRYIKEVISPFKAQQQHHLWSLSLCQPSSQHIQPGPGWMCSPSLHYLAHG